MQPELRELVDHQQVQRDRLLEAEQRQLDRAAELQDVLVVGLEDHAVRLHAHEFRQLLDALDRPLAVLHGVGQPRPGRSRIRERRGRRPRLGQVGHGVQGRDHRGRLFLRQAVPSAGQVQPSLEGHIGVFVALGAQDCLIKSKVDSDSFARAMRYAVTRKRAEEMSRRTITLENELLQEILQHAPICLATFDADLRVSSCNSVFHSQLGMMPDRVLNRRINELLPSTNVQSWQAVVSQNVSFSDPSCVIQRADDGTEFTWDVTAWPITSRQLSLKRAIIVALDVTERIKLERQKEDFFAALAHDIKNPLAGADRLLNLMSAGTAGSDHDKLIDLLKRSNSNVLTMLHNLLDVYRYEASAVPITLRSIDPTQSIVTAIASVSLIAAERNIAVRTDLSDELDVVADSVALQRLLSNLLHNAIQFSEPGSSVQLQARMADSNTVFRIVDSGHGMSQEEQKYLFKRFGHGTNKQLKQGEGTGLGLYLCKQIVDALNGAITCESALGEGTIFTVTLSRLRK